MLLENDCNNDVDSIMVVSARVSTEALKVFIAEMHNQGCTDSKIAERFGYNRSYINSIRKQMGLTATWGKLAPRFSQEMDDDILTLRDEDNLRWAEIARIIGRSAKDTAERYNFLDQKRIDEEERAPVITKTRKCLSCSTPFESTWIGERCCTTCRERNAGLGSFMDEANDDFIKSV